MNRPERRKTNPNIRGSVLILKYFLCGLLITDEKFKKQKHLK